MTPKMHNDKPLVRAVLEGQALAWTRFKDRIEDGLWTMVGLLTSNQMDARAVFNKVIDGLCAENYSRLRHYDGSCRVEAYVALVARDLLAPDLLRLFRSGCGEEAWVAFEYFFAKDMRRIIFRRLSGPDYGEARRDAYQEICLALVADNFRRLTAYQEIGSFGGYVLHVVDRLLIDFIRKPTGQNLSGSTRTQLLSEEWENIPSPDLSPEAALLAREREGVLSSAGEVLRQAVGRLSPNEQLYLQVTLASEQPMPAREMARRICRPVSEVYKLKQRVLAHLHRLMDHHPSVKMWRACA